MTLLILQFLTHIQLFNNSQCHLLCLPRIARRETFYWEGKLYSVGFPIQIQSCKYILYCFIFASFFPNLNLCNKIKLSIGSSGRIAGKHARKIKIIVKPQDTQFISSLPLTCECFHFIHYLFHINCLINCKKTHMLHLSIYTHTHTHNTKDEKVNKKILVLITCYRILFLPFIGIK